MNKSNILALLEEIRCDYDSDVDVDEDFDKDFDITYQTDPLSRAQGDNEIESQSSTNHNRATLCTDDKNGNDATRANSTNTQSRCWRKISLTINPSNFTSHRTSETFTASPIPAFQIFFDEEMIESLHFQTNLYCIQKGRARNITKDKLYTFFGINLLMTYHKLPTLKCHWMTANDMGIFLILEVMTRDCFLYILSNLHVNDNSKIDSSQSNKIFQIRLLVQRLNYLFVQKRSPSEQVSVDESMTRFKGRTSLKQYISMKPIRCEYKLWCIVYNGGYVYKFEVYTGKIFRKRALLKILVWQAMLLSVNRLVASKIPQSYF